jgi:hypothetical protein
VRMIDRWYYLFGHLESEDRPGEWFTRDSRWVKLVDMQDGHLAHVHEWLVQEVPQSKKTAEFLAEIESRKGHARPRRPQPRLETGPKTSWDHILDDEDER